MTNEKLIKKLKFKIEGLKRMSIRKQKRSFKKLAYRCKKKLADMSYSYWNYI